MNKLYNLKTKISQVIMKHIADKEGMALTEYASVYDSNKHEDMLEAIIREIRAVYHPGANERLKEKGL